MPLCRPRSLLAATALLSLLAHSPAGAQESGWGWFSGEWSLTVGAAGSVAPEFEGSDEYGFFAQPLISLGRRDTLKRFESRNDSASFAIIDTGVVSFGPALAVVLPRDEDDSDDLRGLDDVPWGVEPGLFLNVFPTDWARLRAEIRKGFHAHEGIVADFYADAFTNITPTIQVSGGPRLSLATEDYFETYYGVTPNEAIASGLSPFEPDGGGLRSAGVGGAVTWHTTDKVTTSVFAEYRRLLGDAADSSLVEERGSPNQFLIGVSATYRFDFAM
jgi:outer membrane scaffolding protein for murein synthesis (MipA/OmpV family)